MEIPDSIRSDIKEFVRIDDGLKDAHTQMKSTREDMKGCIARIIAFMRQAEMEKFSLKKGEQSLILQEKTLKIRPSADVLRARLAEMLSEGQKDSAYIWDELNKCGGTKTTWKLARRSKRKASEKKASKKRAHTEMETEDE